MIFKRPTIVTEETHVIVPGASRVPLGAALAVAALLTSSAWSASGGRLRVDLRTEYTDNLFHYSDSQLDDFGTANDPGERFDDIDHTSDVVARLRIRSDYTFELGKRQDLRLFLNGSWFQHAENDIADYGKVGAGIRADLTRRDELELRAEQVIDRFKKNYRLPDSATFAEASYDQTEVSLGYTRRIGKRKRRLYAGMDVRTRSRRYNDVFESRDQDAEYLGLRTAYRLGKRLDGHTSVGYGDIESETGLDGGILIDRSYEQYLVSQRFELDLRHRVDVALQVDLRRREYGTEEAADLARNGREDDYARLRLEVDKGWKNGLTFSFLAAAIENDSDRLDPTVETDETGYDEATVAIGLEYRF
jgi:hypothetical protein